MRRQPVLKRAGLGWEVIMQGHDGGTARIVTLDRLRQDCSNRPAPDKPHAGHAQQLFNLMRQFGGRDPDDAVVLIEEHELRGQLSQLLFGHVGV